MEAAVKTWICGNCPYRWQFSGEAVDSTPYDLTTAQILEQFPEPQFVGLQAGKCPNCHLKGLSSPLGLSIDPDEMSSITVIADGVLESQQALDVDEHGQPIMIQTGERYELRVNQQTGAVYSELVPIFEQKMRELTTQELADLKEQRDRSLGELERVAV